MEQAVPTTPEYKAPLIVRDGVVSRPERLTEGKGSRAGSATEFGFEDARSRLSAHVEIELKKRTESFGLLDNGRNPDKLVKTNLPSLLQELTETLATSTKLLQDDASQANARRVSLELLEKVSRLVQRTDFLDSHGGANEIRSKIFLVFDRLGKALARNTPDAVIADAAQRVRQIAESGLEYSAARGRHSTIAPEPQATPPALALQPLSKKEVQTRRDQVLQMVATKKPAPGIPLYEGRRAVPAVAFFQANYAPFVISDVIFTTDLKTIDPALLTALRNECRNGVPMPLGTKSDRTSAISAGRFVDDEASLRKSLVAVAQREARQGKTKQKS